MCAACTSGITELFSGGDAGSITVTGGPLTFTTENRMTPQTITVTGVNDDIVNEGGTRFAAIVFRTRSTDTAGTYNFLSGTGPLVTIIDDDAPVSTTIAAIPSPAEAQTVDAGDTVTYRVWLNRRPAGDVTVRVFEADSSVADSSITLPRIIQEAWASPARLFAPAGVACLLGSLIRLRGLAVCGLSAFVLALMLPAAAWAQLVNISPGFSTINEGSSVTLNVRLASAPSGNRIVDIDVPSGSNLVMLSTTELTFTSSNWSQNQQVMVTSVDDNILGQGQAQARIRFQGANLTPNQAFVNINEATRATVTVSPARAFVGTSSTNPNQRVGSFTHVLDLRPTGTVSATVTSRNNNLVRPLVSSYTFNTSSTDPSLGWNVPRTVNLAAFTRGASGSTTIDIAYSGGSYDGVTVEVPVTVLNQSPASIPD